MHFLSQISLGEALWGLGIFSLGVTLSIALVVVVLVRMPATYFWGDNPPSLLLHRPRWQQRAAHVGKNALGVLLVLLGVILSIPGVPGQGVLTILIGMTLVDFPGKRRFEQRIMRNPTVHGAANRIRSRFGKAPFVLDQGPL